MASRPVGPWGGGALRGGARIQPTTAATGGSGPRDWPGWNPQAQEGLRLAPGSSGRLGDWDGESMLALAGLGPRYAAGELRLTRQTPFCDVPLARRQALEAGLSCSASRPRTPAPCSRKP